MRFWKTVLFSPFMFSLGFTQEKRDLPRSYTIFKTIKAPLIDGKIEKREWEKAQWSELFSDISDSSKPLPPLDTRCKMMWDDDHLYIAAEMTETDLWATLKTRDAIVYNDHDFEVFIDPNNDGQQYFEIEINALGTVMDLFMNKPYKKGGRFDIGWDAVGLRTAVKLYGTLNNNADRDKKWTVEMAIPFDCLKREGRISHPVDGSSWRINFSRVEWPNEKNGSTYKGKMAEQGKRTREFNWVWSPTGVIDMHLPATWGYLHFKQ